MPFGPWDSFNDCLTEMQGRYDDETARKVCGALQAKLGDRSKKSADCPGGCGGEKKERTKRAALASNQMGAPIAVTEQYSRSVTVVASTQNPAGGQPALTSWDLERFKKNPVVLFAHDSSQLPIGVASDIEFGPEGLKCRITFASEKANPLAEQVWCSIQEKILRGVSVGYELKGSNHAELVEISVVPIPLDEDAGTADINPDAVLSDEEMAARVKRAASDLAKHRARLVKKRQEAMVAAERAKDKAGAATNGEGDPVVRTDSFRFDAGGKLDKARRTSLGGAYINARLTRVGVLTYRMPDGSVRRELRPPEEVFKADSLATLDSVPVIDIRHHVDLITPEDYKRATVGHLKSYRQDGTYVAGELVVQDADTLEAIDAGERTEISCGYVCRHDMTPGVWEGQPYDCVQRDIQYNHVALCPPNRGRAGPEVGLRLDQGTGARWGVAQINQGEQPMKVVRIDGTDYEVGSDAHIAKVETLHKEAMNKLETAHKAKLDSLEADKTAAVAAAVKSKDEMQAKLDALESELESFRADAKKAKEKAGDYEQEKAKSMREKIKNSLRILRFFSSEDDDEDEDDDDDDDDKDSGKDGKKSKSKSKSKKMDARIDQLLADGGERAAMIEIIKRTSPKFDATDKSDDYVRARFDAEQERERQERSVDGIVRHVETEKRRLDAADADVLGVVKARMEAEKRSQEAWKTSAQNGGK